MTIRAKFSCIGKKPTEGDESTGTVTLEAVTNEPASWSKWTPYGQLTMGTVNAEAFKQFEVGKSYFLDITKAEEFAYAEGGSVEPGTLTSQLIDPADLAGKTATVSPIV